MSLDEFRSTVDFIDDEILTLLTQRFQIVEKIIEYKKNNNLPILNKNRENIIMNKIIKEHPSFQIYLCKIYKKIIKNSKKYQKNILKSKKSKITLV